MLPPKVVVFDLGKVLLDFDYGIAARKIASRGRLSADDIKRFIDNSPLLFQFETGLLTLAQFFEQVCSGTGYSGELGEFCSFFADIFAPIPAMVELQSLLRRSGTPTFIFSNTNELAIGHIRRNFPFFTNFDGYVLSYEHGAMKPDPKLYQVVEAQTGRRGAEILYLDDRPENVDAGKRQGWRVILHESPEKTLQLFESSDALRSLLGPQKV
jgi:FMN phosphatase YigB (HAD superfamily)